MSERLASSLSECDQAVRQASRQVDENSSLVDFLNQAHAWFPEIVLRKVCVCVYVCMYVYLFVFPHPREQTFYLKLKSSLYTNNKG